jgi:hypothetical protein
MSEATLARRVAQLREDQRRESAFTGVAWPSGHEEREPTWLDRVVGLLAFSVGAMLVAALVLGFLAPEGCPPAEAILGDAHACDAYVKDEAYWNARLGTPLTDNLNDKE